MRSSLLERIVLCCLVAVLSTAVLVERKEHGHTVERARLAEQDAERAHVDLRFAIETLNRHQSDHPRLIEGIDVSTGASVAHEGAGNRAYYIIRTDCAPCAANLPLLDSLHRAKQLSIVGVGTDEPPDVLREYARNHGLSFPVVHLTSGALRNLRPEEISPILLRFAGNRLTAFRVGALLSDDLR